MRSVQHARGRAMVAVATLSFVTAALVTPVSATPSGTVGVTGGSSSKIELTIPDATAAFGTNLTPDGDASTSGDPVGVNIDTVDPSTGACYEWGGTAVVRSNKAYALKVAAGAANARLDFLTSNPATFTACTSGESVSTTMYTSATPAGAWSTANAKTAKFTHSFWLGLAVLWTDDPSGTVGAATLTLSATAVS